MKWNSNFQINPAFCIGIMLICACSFVRNVLEPEGSIKTAFSFLNGVGVGLALIGFLFGAPVTRPLFDHFHALKLRLLGF